MSDDDSEEEERTQLNVEVDDPDETADRSREMAKAMGVLPSDADTEGSTLMADPDRMRRLAEQAASDADQDEPASIVSFVSNVSVVTQSVEVPSPIGGPLPADVEPSTMGSITLDPQSRAPADAEPITIEPRMGVRGMMPGPKPARSRIQSDVDTGAQQLLAQEEISTATVQHADIVRSVAADPAAAARLAKNAPRPAGKDTKALPKRSKTVIGLAPPAGASDVDGKEAETQSDVRVGTLPLGPLTEPLPTAPLPRRTLTPMRERTNSEEALIAHALAIPETGGEFKPSTFQSLPDMPPKTLAIPQTPAMASPAVPPAPGSNPAMPVASRAPGSSPGIMQPDGPTPAGMVFENLGGPKPKSNAGMIVGFFVAGVVLLGAGTALGWVLRSARMPVSAATTASSAPPPRASASASAEPDKKEEKTEPAVEAKSDPEPEKKADLELKNDPPPEKTEKTETAKKSKPPPWRPAATKPPPWKPATPKPSAKPVAVPVPPPPPAPTQPKSFDPGGI